MSLFRSLAQMSLSVIIGGLLLVLSGKNK